MVQTKADREKQKLITDKCQALIEVLLKDEDNKYCVDCDAKGPRWASWNLGIFMCIRCAGIHRNLGVHISRVKSVNLDAWTPEHVAHVQRMGNSKARAIYEANLPDDFRRPQTDTALESFIRAKYEHKRYIDQSYVDPGPPEPAFNAEEELKRIKEQKKSKLNSGNNKTMISVSDSFAPAVTASSRHQSSSSISSPSKSRSSSATTTQQPQQPSLLLGNDSFTSGGGASAAANSNMSSNSNTTSTLNSESNKPKSNLADLMDLDLSFGSFNLMPSNMSSFEANPSNPFPALARMNTLNTTATNLNNNLNSILNNSFNMDGAATAAAAAAAAASPAADNNISQPPMTGNTGKNVFDLLNL